MSVALVPLSPLSEDFGRIEYELQLELNAPKLVVSECFDLSNPHVSAQFLTFTKSLLPQNIVNVYITTAQLGQSIMEIESKGIRVDPKRGLRFKVGTFDVNREEETIEVVRLTVALGSSLNFKASDTILTDDSPFLEETPTSTSIHPGYHSLCVSNEHEYVIFNSAQVKASHLIRFAGGENLAEASEADDICDLCQEKKATIWCVNDSAKLCETCDRDSHSGNRILERHKRMPLSDARALMEFCPLHKDVRVEYYCPQCQVPVCLTCKMTGSHSKGEAASHPLISIKQAYAEAVEASEHEDPIFVRRKAAIKEKLEAADVRLKEITANVEHVENEIMRIAHAAIKRAKELAGEKALAVLSAKTELIRKEAELDALTKFIVCHKKTSGPLSFLRAFDRQSSIVGSMQGTADLPLDLKVEGDLSVFGSLDVSPRDKPITATFTPPGSPVRPTPEPAPPRVVEAPKPQEVVPNPPVVPPAPPMPDPEPEEPEEESGKIEKSPSKPAGKKRSSLKRKSETGPEYISLVALAQRREQKNHARGMELTFQPFQGSAILTTPAQCAALYLCFPFKAQPQTHLLFSTERDGRSIQKMHQMIDGIGITTVLIKKDEFIFGGFAAVKWKDDGEPFGEGSSSFLFSVSQDAFIPYRPRVSDACHLLATPYTLTFGKYDLILADDFDGCSAMLENSYGIGFNQGSTEAQTFLAGETNFRADVVEVWGFFTIEQQ